MNTKIDNEELVKKILKNNKIEGTNAKMVNGSNTEYTLYTTINVLNSEVIDQNEYSEFYYKYVNKFEELEGYLFSKLFWSYEKSDNNSF